MAAKDNIGEKFNRLTVIDVERVGKHYYWICKCDCGNTTRTRSDWVKTGHTKSCGCRSLETRYPYKHGMTKTRLFNTWQKMIARCEKENDKYYSNYGGRGIKVCEEWHDSTTFINWALENGYDDMLTIERKDINGDYCPDNCCWITMGKQARNRSTTRWVEYNGKTMSLAEVCEITNSKYSRVQDRLNRGWSLEDAINLPVGSKIK